MDGSAPLITGSQSSGGTGTVRKARWQLLVWLSALVNVKQRATNLNNEEIWIRNRHIWMYEITSQRSHIWDFTRKTIKIYILYSPTVGPLDDQIRWLNNTHPISLLNKVQVHQHLFLFRVKSKKVEKCIPIFWFVGFSIDKNLNRIYALSKLFNLQTEMYFFSCILSFKWGELWGRGIFQLGMPN